MQHEHLVDVNPRDDGAAPLLTPAQLWRGLVRRAEDPVPFVAALERCVILRRSRNHLDRELHFGAVTIRDRVTFTARTRVHYEVHPDANQPGGTLEMSIEQPGENRLCVRFAYSVPPGGAAAASDEQAELVRRAYEAADRDTIRLIRRLAADDQLG